MEPLLQPFVELGKQVVESTIQVSRKAQERLSLEAEREPDFYECSDY